MSGKSQGILKWMISGNLARMTKYDFYWLTGDVATMRSRNRMCRHVWLARPQSWIQNYNKHISSVYGMFLCTYTDL